MTAPGERYPARTLVETSVAGLPDRRAAQDKRLSLGHCRTLLPAGISLSSTELELLRDQMYALAEVVTDEFVRINKREERATDASKLKSSVSDSATMVPV